MGTLIADFKFKAKGIICLPPTTTHTHTFFCSFSSNNSNPRYNRTLKPLFNTFNNISCKKEHMQTGNQLILYLDVDGFLKYFRTKTESVPAHPTFFWWSCMVRGVVCLIYFLTGSCRKIREGMKHTSFIYFFAVYSPTLISILSPIRNFP